MAGKKKAATKKAKAEKKGGNATISILEAHEVLFKGDTKNFFRVWDPESGVEAVLLSKDLARKSKIPLKAMPEGHFLMSLAFVPKS